jgi:hypothetical protein
MLDVSVAEPQLQRPRVVAVVRQLDAAGVPEHVGVGGEREFRVLAGSPSQDSSSQKLTITPHA